MTPATRWRRWRSLLIRFAAGQLSVQAVNVVIGLAVMRWLPIAEYAKFGIAFAFQCTIGMLIDLGISNSIIALVGDRGDDPTIVGGFLKSAQHYRDRMFLILVVAAAVAFPLLTARQPWSLTTRFALLSAIIAYVYVQRSIMFSSALLIHRRLGGYYGAQLIAALFRLAGTATLFGVGHLSAVSAAWLSTITCAALGWMYMRQAQPFIAEPSHPDPELNRQTRQLILPQIPAIVFTAFQSQIAISLIAILGTERSLAEVSALGRLGQLFLMLSATNSVLIEPVMARSDVSSVVRRYISITGIAIVIAIAILSISYLFPEPLLMLMGSKYRSVRSDIALVVASACVNYIAGVLCVLNNSRRYRFWWYAGLEIVTVLGTQCAAIYWLNMSATRGAIMFSLMTNMALVVAHACGGIGGMIHEQGTATIAQPLADDSASAAVLSAEAEPSSFVASSSI